MLWSCRYFTLDKVELGIQQNASASHCYHQVKNN